ncbi:MAG: hypothetical protein Q7R33_02865 [Nitrosarchaeum sp.]|nr:hypothetical protein [Nitrosarchaeum sp.]
MSLKDVFRCSPGKPYRKVKLENIKAGDLFYTEHNGKLCDMDNETGQFILLALENGQKQPAPTYASVHCECSIMYKRR